MNNDNIDQDNESIDFDKLDLNTNIPQKNKQIQKKQLLHDFTKEYVESLKQNYDADTKLFDMISELLEESEDKEKSIQILNSL
jgi:hypothetical protein